MYKKILTLILTIGCINSVLAENTSYVTFTNPDKVKLDQLKSAQARINYLQQQCHYTKPQMGAALTAGSMLFGGAAIFAAQFIEDEATRTALQKGFGAAGFFGSVGGFSLMAFGSDDKPAICEEERKEAEELQKFILSQTKHLTDKLK